LIIYGSKVDYYSPRLFINFPNNDYYSPHICLKAKGEKTKTKSKAKAPLPSPPSDISSSDLSDSSSDDESSNEEIDQITKNLDPKTKLLITKLMEYLESVQAELEFREKTLIQQEDLYIASKKALALERSEVKSLHKALAKEQGDHAMTKKENIAVKKKYCDLDEKHIELELQYNALWATHIPIRQMIPLLPPLVKVVKNVIILI
jgi:chromosome segregation ATPase